MGKRSASASASRKAEIIPSLPFNATPKARSVFSQCRDLVIVVIVHFVQNEVAGLVAILNDPVVPRRHPRLQCTRQQSIHWWRWSNCLLFR